MAALFQNWDQVSKAQDIAANSMGTTNDKYQIYLQSIEAASNKMKASWEKVWQVTVNNDVIKFFYNLSAGIADVISESGGLIPILTTIVGLLVAFKGVQIAQTITGWVATIKTAIAANTALGVSFSAALGPIGLIIAAIGLLAIAISAIPDASERLEKTLTKITEINTKISELESKTQTIRDLSAEFKTLEEKNTSRTAEEQQKFVDIQNQLKDLLPQIAGYYDQSGNFIISDEALSSNQAYLDLLQQQIDSEKELLFIQTKKEIKQGATAYEQNATDISFYSGVLNTGRSPVAGGGALTPEQIDFYKEQIATLTSENAKFLTDVAANWGDFSDEQQSQLMQILANSEDFGKELTTILAGSIPVDPWGAAWEKLHPPVEDLENSLTPVERSLEDVSSAMEAVSKASQEQSKEGQISYSTALDLISANASLAQYLTQTADGYIFDAEAAKLATFQEMQNAFAKYNISSAAVAAANGNYIFAQSAIASANATEAEKTALYGLLKTFAAMNVKVSLPSGGGSGVSAQEKLNNLKKEAYQQEIKAINAQKKAAQDQIKALQDKKDAFNDIIDAQKESLRLTKEENDYQKELQEKNKELADIDAELIQLQFDNSEEGNARRLELEEERAEKTADIAEYQADRTYDIQTEALDREADAYAKMIDMQIAGVQTMIDGYDAVIAKINEMIDALSKLASASSGGGSYGAPTTTSNLTAQGNKKYTGTSPSVVNAEIALGRDLNNNGILGLSSGGSFETNSSGLIRVHPNEIGAVLNKSQISAAAPFASFMSSIIKNSGTPQISSNGSGGGGVSIGDIQISVAGNLDKAVLPDLKEMIMKTITDATRNTGTLRNAKSFSV